MNAKRRFAGIAALMLLCGLWLLGCQAVEFPIPPLLTESKCEEPGIVQPGIVEETSRGFDYNYVIYLPPCYESNSEQTYPVLYMLPGRGSGPGSWFAAGASTEAEQMILSEDVSPFLIVGTEEISSDPFGETIYRDLIPHIENSYRAKPERKHRAVAGGSLGSIGAYRLAFQHPDQFSSVGMFGGGLIQGEETRVHSWLDALSPEDQPRFFLNTGEQDPLMLDRALAMIGMLDEQQIPHSEIFTPGEHTYAYWVSNFPAYLEWLAQDWN